MIPLLANTAWWLSCLPERWRFERDCARVRATQERLLQHILKANAASPYGQEHRFSSLGSLREFQAAVPVMEPGQVNLSGLTAEPILLYEPTGGSGGGSRLVPYTARLRSQFRRAIAVWVAELFWRRPGLMRGKAYWSITPPPPEQEGVGFDHDGEYLGPLGRWVLKNTLAVPPEVKSSSDFWAETCRGLLATPDLRLISVWSPTYLLVLEQQMRQLVGGWRPRDWWPRLQLISCWADGTAGRWIPQVRASFPEVEIQAKGLLATEGVVTVPFSETVHPLCLRSHVFEFLQGDRVFAAWELERGEQYELLLTTGGGLYRYRLGDRVEVTGFYRECPCLRFFGRASVSDHCGEKLHEEHALRALAGITGFAMLAYEESGYLLFLDGQRSPEELERIRESVESVLEENFHYQNCRRLGQLAPLGLFLVEGNGQESYLQACQQMGQRLGDVKARALHPAVGWSGRLPGRLFQAGSIGVQIQTP